MEGNQEEDLSKMEIDENLKNEEKLKDFTYVIDQVLIPLQTKDIVKKVLENFKGNIENSFNQINKNITLGELDILDVSKDKFKEIRAKDNEIQIIIDKVNENIAYFIENGDFKTKKEIFFDKISSDFFISRTIFPTSFIIF